jgi:hypothetical protein
MEAGGETNYALIKRGIQQHPSDLKHDKSTQIEDDTDAHHNHAKR